MMPEAVNETMKMGNEEALNQEWTESLAEWNT
jgi:hypothetical protein